MTTSGEITLEHILDFLSLDREPEKINVHPTLTHGLGIDNRESILSKSKESYSVCRSPSDVNYYKKYQEEEEKLAIKQFQQNWCRQTIDIPGAGTILVGQLNQIEELNSMCSELPEVNDLNVDENIDLYLKYITPGHSYDPNLVITPFKDKIVRMIEINQVVIIQGSTGSGKTTQVPQYILDYCAGKKQPCNIIVTQPRRIAAMSVARRVCQERQWQLGSFVGYQVALDGMSSPETRLTYVTTGVLLHKLLNKRRMDAYTHIIIDEVHERDQDTDFTLLIVRKLLRSNSRTVKVILMSATFDTTKFAEYFSIPVRGKLEPAPVFEIPGKRRNVAEYYLNDLRSLGTLPEIDSCTPSIEPLAYTLAYKLLKVFDTIDAREQEIESEEEGLAPYRGAVLIFLPGYEEISRMRETIRNDLTIRRWWVIPLHSTITSEEQSQVFNKPQAGYRKIIMSTNIAESSITVPDIKYVIDFCLTKNLVSDPETNYTSLQLDWASKANCAQRKGRAGRVCEGRCYRMVPMEFYEAYLPEFGIPEMKRSPLEQLVLKSKKLEMGEPKGILALAIDPPSLNGIERAVLVLKEVGALSVTANGYPTPHDGDLTFVGEVMSQLPLDVKVSKLILLGYACGCLQEALIIAASLSLKDFFAKPFQKFLEAYKSRLAWAHGSFSDCIAYLYAYKVWEAKVQSGQFRPPNARQKEEEWGRKNFIQMKKIKEVHLLIQELTNRLEKFNITVKPCNPQFSAEHILILKIIIAGAFYPNYFIQEETDEKEINKQVSSRDPLATVEIRGLPPNQGQLYISALREMLSCCSTNMDVYFEERRALVEFLRSDKAEVIGILPAVYLAVKMRQLRMPLELQVYSKEEGNRKLEQLRRLKDQKCEKVLKSNQVSVQVSEHCNSIKQIPLPSLKTITIRLFVTTVVECGHFWAQYRTPETQMNISFIHETINMYQGKNLKPLSTKPVKGMIVLAPYLEDFENRGPLIYYERIDSLIYYRAKVEDVYDIGIKVFFIDYGNRLVVPEVSFLKEIDVTKTPDLMNIPSQAFECTLCELRPSVIKNPNGMWTEEAKAWFSNRVSGQDLVARIYSVVQNIVRLELILVDSSNVEISINRQLIQYKFAEPAEESYASKKNHDIRMKLEMSDTCEHDIQQDSEFVHLTMEEVSQVNSYGQPTHKMKLIGPFSPLESTYKGVTRLASCRRIHIDRDSVNSVVLDCEPQDKHTRLLVSSYVSLGSDGSAINARNTTLMPNLHGLLSFVLLIFSPSAEFRTDRDRRYYTGAICGLGCDEEGRSLYADHDTELVFETSFECEDIVLINSIRMGINLLLGKEEGPVNFEKCKIQERVKSHMLKLLSQNRESIEPKEHRYIYRWKQIDEEYLLKPKMVDNISDCPHVLPLHKAVMLTDVMIQDKLRNHIIELHSKVKSKSKFSEFNKCLLCGVTMPNLRELEVHLQDINHKSLEVRLFEE